LAAGPTCVQVASETCYATMAVRDRLSAGEWRRVGGMAAFILLLHVLGFGILGLLVVPGHYHLGARAFGFGTGVLAYTLGMRRGRYDQEELERQLDSRGLMNRFFGPLARRVDAPWKMYPMGLLFGLGFDTATEIALLVLAGGAVASGLPFYAILCLPILFAA